MLAAKSSEAPPFNALAYGTFLLLGLGLLAPWNFVLNSLPYFGSLYVGNTASVAVNIGFYISAAYSYPAILMQARLRVPRHIVSFAAPCLTPPSRALLLAQFVLVLYGARVSTTTRIVGSAALQAVAVTAMPLLSRSSPWTPVLLMFVCGLGTAVMQASVMGVVSRFPPAYSAGFMLGQGLVGIVSSALQIAIKAAVQSRVAPDGSLPASVNAAAATGYFVFAAALMVACGAGFYALDQTAFADFYLRGGVSKADGGSDSGDAGCSGGDAGAADADADADAGDADDADGQRALLRPGSGGGRQPWCSPVVVSAASKARLYIAALFLTFFVTFLLFPGVLIDRIPYRGGLGSRAGFLGTPKLGWWGVVLLAVFNVFDTVGRSAAGLPALTALSAPALVGAVVARGAFVVLMLGCALAWRGFGDGATLALDAGFALTNGLFASLAFIGAPRASGVTPAEQQSVGMLLSISLNLGILVGSNAAFAFAGIAQVP